MIKKCISFQMYRWRAYRSHGCRKRGAYKPHCQLMNHMIRRLPLRIRDPHMSLQPIQYEMHLCVFLPIHWCTNLWSKLILSKTTKFEEDWDKNSMKDPILSTFSCKKLRIVAMRGNKIWRIQFVTSSWNPAFLKVDSNNSNSSSICNITSLQ